MGCGHLFTTTELAKELEENRGGSSSSGIPNILAGHKCRKVDNIVDLKLGNLNSLNLMMQPYSTSTTSSSSGGGGSSRRSRGSAGASQVASCLVDGCKSDLSKCRDYHRRHKVCELHSKTPRVTIGGLEQRFCQQCSRFHSLGEFDEGKRSCRKRLEGHNRRRRKPQPDALNPANFLSTGRGGRFLPFSSSPMIPAGSVVSSAWSAGPMKPESSSSALYNTSHHHLQQLNMFGGGNRYTSNAYRGRQFPFLQCPDSSSSTPSTPPNNNNLTTSIGVGVGVGGGGDNNLNDHTNHNGRLHHNLFCENNNGLTGGAQVIHSTDRALSLLSSSSSHGENPTVASASPHTGIGFGRMIHPMSHHHHQLHPHHLASVAGLTYNGIAHFTCSSPSTQMLDVSHHHSHAQGVAASAAVTAGLNISTTVTAPEFHCQDVFQAASEGSASSASGPHQTLSFSWE